ncbi:DPH4 homolog [Drosophila tropicalis]|uniref:DPH4 homolog n=1 Tax=Drosophila tropicalis TaxID=46794 RepID=UPI0035ABD3E6
MSLNFYELLDVRPTATFEELKHNYKQLILQCHPDKLQQQQQLEENDEKEPPKRPETVNATNDPNLVSQNSENHSKFNAINEAWQTLKDPIRRKHYDAELLQSKFQKHSNIYAHILLNEMRQFEEEDDDDDDDDNDNLRVMEGKENESDKKTSTTTTTRSKVWSYAYDCRCGGQYVVDARDTTVSAIGSADDESASEMIVECNECSLVIVVKQQK